MRARINSVVSYPERGLWGKASFRGNATGHLLKDLIDFYQPKSVLDPMEGSGTSRDVCRELGVEYDGFDLSQGFDLFSSPLPCKRYGLVYWHPPYLDLIKYSDDPRDMSIRQLGRFMEKLFVGLNRLSEYLSDDGVLVLLLGDVRRRGQYFPLSAYVQVFRRKELRAKLIKIQHNVASSRRSYPGKFVPIMHEECLVLKPKPLTWRELVLRTLKELGGKATLGELYAAIAAHPKRLSNPTYYATVRRTVQEAAAPGGEPGLWRWLK